jgi:serine protease Do
MAQACRLGLATNHPIILIEFHDETSSSLRDVRRGALSHTQGDDGGTAMVSKTVILSAALTFVIGMAGGVVGAYGYARTTEAGPANQGGGGGPVQVVAPAAPDGIANLVERVKVAVVNIDTEARREVPPDPFDFLYGDAMPAPRQQLLKGVGSGFVVRDDGLIVTNAHVVQGAERLTVTFFDGRKLEGRVVGADPATDLAHVRVSGRGLATLQLADPGSLKVGQYVVAMGSPLGLSQSVSMGILSAMNRDIALNSRVGFLQTDAPINPGNSGGPLLNLRGEVIGVNTAIAASAQGIGFAIPVGTLRSVLPQLERSGKVDQAWLGARVANLPEDKTQMVYPAQYGVLVAGVEKGSPVEQAGVRPGDVLMQLNGQRLDDSASLIREVAKLTVGSKVELLVSRQGQRRTMTLVLGRMPERLGHLSPQPAE